MTALNIFLRKNVVKFEYEFSSNMKTALLPPLESFSPCSNSLKKQMTFVPPSHHIGLIVRHFGCRCFRINRPPDNRRPRM
jgi:hypothetical protein